MAFRKRFVGELRFHQDETVGVIIWVRKESQIADLRAKDEDPLFIASGPQIASKVAGNLRSTRLGDRGKMRSRRKALPRNRKHMLRFDRTKKGSGIFSAPPFGFTTYSCLEKFSYKILADFLGTAQRLTVDHENGNRFCATERN